MTSTHTWSPYDSTESTVYVCVWSRHLFVLLVQSPGERSCGLSISTGHSGGSKAHIMWTRVCALSRRWWGVCSDFHTKLLNHPSSLNVQVCIPVVSVRLVKKHKTAGLVPNGLAITMDTGQKVPHRTGTHQRHHIITQIASFAAEVIQPSAQQLWGSTLTA